MHILTLLSKLIEDVNLERWEEDEAVYFSGKSIAKEVMSILNIDDISGNCVVAFKPNEDNYFEVSDIECNGITYDVNKIINDCVMSQSHFRYDIYHRLCEEAVR